MREKTSEFDGNKEIGECKLKKQKKDIDKA